METLSISDIISLFAFFIGLYGAILSTMIAFEEMLKLKIKYLDISYLTLSYSNEFLNDHGEHIDWLCKDKYTLAIKVRISNNSKSPTTINEFILNNKYKFNSSFNIKNSSIPSSFEYYDGYLTHQNTIILENKLLKPLLQINPLSSVEGFIIFTQLPNVPKKIKIRIDAVQRIKTYHLTCDNTVNYTNGVK